MHIDPISKQEIYHYEEVDDAKGKVGAWLLRRRCSDRLLLIKI
jgi:hypothetical protein